MADVTVLETKGLTKTYGGLTAVRDVDFQLAKGKVTALIGPNGAGKSTFVGMICGRIEASAGRVFFDGQDISRLPSHKRIQLGLAYTFQITSIFPGLSVYDNVATAAGRVLSNNPKALRDKVEAVLTQVGLIERAEQIASSLSYGHQRSLEIAMGLAQDPKVFMLDEPTQGLSDGEVDAFIKLIRELAGDTTILLIEHNMRVVMEAADHITVLDQGAVLAEGTPEEIKTNKAVQTAYLGTIDHA